MATWQDVERLGLELPETSPGTAHEGSAALTVGDVQFARLRASGDGREVLQFWVPERELVAAYVEENPLVFRAAPGFSKKVVMAELALLDLHAVREILAESWAARAPGRVLRAHLRDG
jgi:hypothetical protein